MNHDLTFMLLKIKLIWDYCQIIFYMHKIWQKINLKRRAREEFLIHSLKPRPNNPISDGKVKVASSVVYINPSLRP